MGSARGAARARRGLPLPQGLTQSGGRLPGLGGAGGAAVPRCVLPVLGLRGWAVLGWPLRAVCAVL